MEYVYDYLVFLAQAITLVVAILIVVGSIASHSLHLRAGSSGHLEIVRLNHRLDDMRHALEDAVLLPGEAKKRHKEEHKAERKAEKRALKAAGKHPAKTVEPASASDASDASDSSGSSESSESSKSAKPSKPSKLSKLSKPEDSPESATDATGRTYVLTFNGDVQASSVDQLATEVSAVLTMAKPEDEVVVRVESPGGLVHGYGLAASQLLRIRTHGVPLVVAVDKVAASGGYLMAAVANRILAAPFALVGSVGVVAQIPNVHRLLKKNDVDVEILTAGKYKRTLTMFGENTEEGRQKFIDELEDVHALFQEFVAEYRPTVDLEKVATGEAWYGQRAITLKLVDELVTSDDYLMGACKKREVFEVRWVVHRKPIDRIMGHIGTLVNSLGWWPGRTDATPSGRPYL